MNYKERKEKEIRDILNKATPPNLKSAVYKCKECEDTGNVFKNNKFAGYCICGFRNMKEKIWGVEYREKTLDNYICDTIEQKQQIEYIKTHIKESYFLMGVPGIGKTHIMAGIHEELFKLNRTDMSKYKIFKEIDMYKVFKKINFDMGTNYIIQDIRCREIKAFFLDDFGQDNFTNSSLSDLFTLLDDLKRYEVQMIISTNLDLPYIEKEIGEARARRFKDVCKILTLKEGSLL